jgi:hypothetical protein
MNDLHGHWNPAGDWRIGYLSPDSALAQAYGYAASASGYGSGNNSMAAGNSAFGNFLRDNVPLLGGILGGLADMVSGALGTAIGVATLGQSGTLNSGLQQFGGGLAGELGYLAGGMRVVGRGLLYGAGFVWTSPNTALGLITGTINFVAGVVMGTHPSIQFHNNALQFIRVPLGQGPSAVTH